MTNSEVARGDAPVSCLRLGARRRQETNESVGETEKEIGSLGTNRE